MQASPEHSWTAALGAVRLFQRRSGNAQEAEPWLTNEAWGLVYLPVFANSLFRLTGSLVQLRLWHRAEGGL